jgi:hypothetical protein
VIPDLSIYSERYSEISPGNLQFDPGFVETHFPQPKNGRVNGQSLNWRDGGRVLLAKGGIPAYLSCNPILNI